MFWMNLSLTSYPLMLIICSAGFVCLLVWFLAYHYNLTVYMCWSVIMQMNSLLVTSGRCLKLLTLSKWKYKYNYQNYQYNHKYKYKWCTGCTRMWYYLCWRRSSCNQQLIMLCLINIDFQYFAWGTQLLDQRVLRSTSQWVHDTYSHPRKDS